LKKLEVQSRNLGFIHDLLVPGGLFLLRTFFNPVLPMLICMSLLISCAFVKRFFAFVHQLLSLMNFAWVLTLYLLFIVLPFQMLIVNFF